jgi:hypothetical protein
MNTQTKALLDDANETLKRAAAELRRLHEVNQELVEALELGLLACRSVSLGRDRKIIDANGEVSYGQTEEWCKWLDSKVAPKLKAVLAKAKENT